MDPRLPHNRVRWAVAAAVGLLAVLLLVVFGGELSREELIERGDEICADAHKDFRELQRDRPTTAAEAEELIDELVQIAESERDEIDDLDGPDELDAQIDRYVAARERGIELMERGRDAAGDRDQSAYVRAQARLASSQLERRQIARQIGFEVCSEPLVGEAELARQAEPPAAAP